MSAPAAGMIGALVGATLGVVVGALLAAVRVAELSERVDWLQWLLDEQRREEQDELVAEFRARLDEWDEG